MRQVDVYDGGDAYDRHYFVASKVNHSSLDNALDRLVQIVHIIPGRVWLGLFLIASLLMFEALTLGATRYALQDLLGEVSFMGWQWATVLAVALCAIDFAGLAYLFTLDQSGLSGREVLYLLGAWILGATMSALLSWWTFSTILLAMNGDQGPADSSGLLPVAGAIGLWLVRIMLVAALSSAPERYFSGPAVHIRGSVR